MTRWLRRHFPVQTPVTVREVDREDGCHGVFMPGEGRSLIRIVKDAPSVMCDTLIEEWSHALRHETPVPIEDEHDAIFWAILSAVTKKWRGE